MSQAAPYFDGASSAIDGFECVFLTAPDGVRLRAAFWPGGEKGTVLLCQGRTEYLEKYDDVARRFLARGWSVAAVDFRGQGLSDRLSDNPRMGHVGTFADYQYDIEAAIEGANAAGLPPVRVILGHSMGGAIVLRSLMNGFAPDLAIFSAPMWGIFFAPTMRVLAPFLIKTLNYLGKEETRAPSTKDANYVFTAPFAGNTLTGNEAAWNEMKKRLTDHPELELGGPSVGWLAQAQLELNTLAHMPSPNARCLCLLGSEELIVSPKRIRRRMAQWPNGRLVNLAGAQHEALIETPDIQERVWSEIDAELNAIESVTA